MKGKINSILWDGGGILMDLIGLPLRSRYDDDESAPFDLRSIN